MEDKKGMVVDNKIFVAVNKELKESKSTLLWALQNSNGKKICIIYVHVPAKMIPMPSNYCFNSMILWVYSIYSFVF